MDDRTVGDIINQMAPFKRTMLRLIMCWILSKNTNVDIRKTLEILYSVCSYDECNVIAYMIDKTYLSIGRTPPWS